MTLAYQLAKVNTLATIKDKDSNGNVEWWIVKRVLDNTSGDVIDQRIEGPYQHEGPADQRASELAMEMGRLAREAASARQRAYSKTYYRSDKRNKRQPMEVSTRNAMARFLGTLENKGE